MDAHVLPSLRAELACLQNLQDLLQKRLSLSFSHSLWQILTCFEQGESGNSIVSIQITLKAV